MYRIELKPRAIKDLKALPKPEAKRIVKKISHLEQGKITVYRVKHRKEAYEQR